MLWLLLVASLLAPAETSMKCANVVATQTGAVRGPDGVAAVLKVYSEDDHSKDRHDCRADYQLLLLPANGGPALVVLPLEQAVVGLYRADRQR
ncbi:MAG TPA: hypothetical protein VN428_18015 [Bryobacteraceae bacterium]|nr:hypothetical protein [Bryobacteraceae bacterium]